MADEKRNDENEMRKRERTKVIPIARLTRVELLNLNYDRIRAGRKKT